MDVATYYTGNPSFGGSGAGGVMNFADPARITVAPTQRNSSIFNAAQIGGGQ